MQIMHNHDMAKYSWFRCGGKAEHFAQVNDIAELLEVIKLYPNYRIIGFGSNLLIRDGIFQGCIIKLGKGFANAGISNCHPSGGWDPANKKMDSSIRWNDNYHIIEFGGGYAAMNAAKFAANHGLSGLEFMIGIPGSIGGCIFMNAGAYGGQTSDYLLDFTAINKAGELLQFNKGDFPFSYRHSGINEDLTIISARFALQKGDKAEITAKMEEIARDREQNQPIREKTGGSTFKNPEGHKAWQLIDEAGMRGYRINDAMISDKHCNFMINLGNASAADLENLGEEVRNRVYQKSGIMLEWEIQRWGGDCHPATSAG